MRRLYHYPIKLTFHFQKVQATYCNFESSTFRDGLYWHSGGTVIVMDSLSMSKYFLEDCCTCIDECTNSMQDASLVSARVGTLRKYFDPGRAPAALSAPFSSSSSSGALDEHVARVLDGAPSETFPSSPHYWLEKRPSRWVFARESVRRTVRVYEYEYVLRALLALCVRELVHTNIVLLRTVRVFFCCLFR